MGIVVYIFIEVDLCLILFLKGDNSGGMGCVPILVIIYYFRLFVRSFLPSFIHVFINSVIVVQLTT